MTYEEAEKKALQAWELGLIDFEQIPEYIEHLMNK